MEKQVQKVPFASPVSVKLKRVAAYARVSSDKDAMLHSLSSQVSYYSSLIQQHGDWLYSGVYSDEGISGTKVDRPGFRSLVNDCRAGKIDMVITKSVSRFARNTVVLLETVRELRSLGIDVYFEEQNIHSISSEGELLLTIVAAYAQAESYSVSENMRWRVQKNFEEGKPWNCTMLGYRYDGEKLVAVPEEAEIVRRVFKEFLNGDGFTKIANRLTEEGVPTRKGEAWYSTPVGKMLRNYTYTGNMILQKTYKESHLSGCSKVNDGSRPMYHVVQNHEAIIPIDEFNLVQLEIERRAEKIHPRSGDEYLFTHLMTCDCCGKHYRRKITATGPVWICTTYNTKGKKYCQSKQIPEDILISTTLTVIDDLNALQSEITEIRVKNGNILEYHTADGKVTVKRWKDRSRSESWTDEMKDAARKRAKEQNHANS